MRLLALDTATECCSVALILPDCLIAREEELGRGHAEHVLAMIDALLTQADVRLTDLDAIAFGRGPGGFTGVRLATSVTQGLAFGADLPVVPVSDLEALAQRALDARPGETRVLAVGDARMREVYWGCFTRDADTGMAQLEGLEHVSPPDAVALPDTWRGTPVMGAGRGLSAYPLLVPRLGLTGCEVDWLPRAREIARLAAPRVARREWLPAQEAVPVYLRDDVAHVPSP